MIIISQKIDSTYQIYTNNLDYNIINQINLFYPIGINRITVNGQDYVTASVGLANNFILGKYNQLSNSTNDPLRCTVLVSATDT